MDSEVRVGAAQGSELRRSCDADVWPTVLPAFVAAFHDPSSETMIALHAAARAWQ